ncbi:MAG: hypothetical protein HUU16_14370, partial [Candidatus Omnitrophica bacterium]|nr:hypothetical protein [Candidatus Omnitrophota bacterium]
VRQSTSLTSDERIRLEFPPDGFYFIGIWGYDVGGAQAPADFEKHVVSGKNVQVFSPSKANLEPGVPRVYQLSTTLAGGLGRYDIILGMGPAGAGRSIQLGLPVFHYTLGDADLNGAIEGLDLVEMSRLWKRSGIVPDVIDFDSDSAIDVDDLIGFLNGGF